MPRLTHKICYFWALISCPALYGRRESLPTNFEQLWRLSCFEGCVSIVCHPKPPWMLCWSPALSMACLVLLFLCVIYVVLCFLFHVLFLSLVSFKPLPKWSLDRRYHTRFVGLYEDESRFTNFAIYQLIFVQRDKVNKSETMCSRTVRDEAEEMIHNWIGKKTLDSHISFVSIKRWKLLMNELLGYGIWFKFSYLSSKFRCIANPVLIGFFHCIGSSKLLGNTLSMLTLATCNSLYFMKC